MCRTSTLGLPPALRPRLAQILSPARAFSVRHAHPAP
jgi:hypothetical protein